MNTDHQAIDEQQQQHLQQRKAYQYQQQQQSPAPPFKMHRTPPPPPPLNPPQTMVSRPPPPPPPSSSLASAAFEPDEDDESTPPPQAPVRTNVNKNSATLQYSQMYNNSLNNQAGAAYSNSSNTTSSSAATSPSSSSAPAPPLRSHHVNSQVSSPPSANLVNASNAAAKLVQKSAMMGSIHSLANPNSNMYPGSHNNSNHHRSEIENLKNPQYNGSSASSSSSKTTDDSGSHNGKLKSITNFTNPYSTSNYLPKTSSLPWEMLPGEDIVDKDKDEAPHSDIIFVMPDNRGIQGKIYITNFRLYFKSDVSQYASFLIDLPLGLIQRIEKIGHQSSKQANSYGLVITCKNGRRLRFANTQETRSRKQIYETLQRFAFPISNERDYFAFEYCVNKPWFPDNDGWSVYDARKEYERMGVSSSNDWRFTEVNRAYRLCSTYPAVLVVPKKVRDEQLEQVGEFRSKHRIPVLSWMKFGPRNTSQAALLRSSQPLCGLTTKRSEMDEKYLEEIHAINTNNALDKIFIVDARPHVNAVANRTTGGGYENEDHYKRCELVFMNIGNIHVMRESLRKIFDMATPATSSSGASVSQASSQAAAAGANGASSAAQTGAVNAVSANDDKNFFLNLENSKWLEHIRCVLNGALKIVKYIQVHNSTVLVHCSDGWDRTSQLTSLAMLMMDKYYRTLRGFEVLIEKEWLSFGHRFGLRMGHGSDKHSDQDRSPIFLQFIDCVWQIMQQNPKVFEFNEKFLFTILQNMYTCQFGTFLYNCEKERVDKQVKTKTVSLWSFINSYQNEFKNLSYVEYDGLVECSAVLQSLQLWSSYYFQYKEIIDDSASEQAYLLNYQMSRPNYLTANIGSAYNQTANSSSYSLVPPAASSKMFGQAFFQQMVNQMKSSVRNSYSSQEPELIRYRASVQASDMYKADSQF